MLITGASGGIGSAVARAFCATGKPVALHYHLGKRQAEQVAQLVRESGGHAELFCADLATPQGVKGLLNDVSRWAGGPLHGLVHAAGAVRDRPVASLTEADWDQVIAVHLSAARHLLAGECIAAGGFALLVGSGAGGAGRAGQAAYATAKSGLAALAHALAPSLSETGVRINTVIPGPVDTPMWERLPPAAKQKVLSAYGLSRPASVDEVAAFIVAVANLPGVSGQVISRTRQAGISIDMDNRGQTP